MDAGPLLSVPIAPHVVDAVITWVDGDDPAHIAKRSRYAGDNPHCDSHAPTRFSNRDEIKYCLWSVLTFCPFVRRIFIVTDSQYPSVLETLFSVWPEWREKVEIVDHLTLYGEHDDLLPVFSSPSIETMLYRIPGLAEHFVYFNDDVFVGRPLTWRHFFKDGRPVLRGRMLQLPNPFFLWLSNLRLGGRPRRAGFNQAQQLAARLLGRHLDYLRTGHVPHPLRRSVLDDFFAGSPDFLRGQAGHRFRSPDQFAPVSLAYHLELDQGAAPSRMGDAGYIKPPQRPRERRRNRATLEKLIAGRLDTVCVQSLDEMAGQDQATINLALENWMAAAPAQIAECGEDRGYVWRSIPWMRQIRSPRPSRSPAPIPSSEGDWIGAG